MSRRVCNTSNMIICFLCILIRSITSEHALNPLDLTCQKRDYRIITDQRSFTFTLNKPSINIHVEIGSNNREISSVITQFWYEQSEQQLLIVRSESEGLEVQGQLKLDENQTWYFQFSSPWYSKSILQIQSTLFEKQLSLIPRNNPQENDHCAYPRSSNDFITCCHPCSPSRSCANLQLLSEHSRDDIIVTNQGLMLLRSRESFDGYFMCSLFPLEQTTRFWSTITDGMNVDQLMDKNDFAIVQYSYGIEQNFFHYSFYPLDQWTKHLVPFDFLDVLFIPHRNLAIFQLKRSSRFVLQGFIYQFNLTCKFEQRIFESIIEENRSTTEYFQMYFHRLSNILYLISVENIYASNDYGQTLIRIWTGDIPSKEAVCLHPLIFADTGHMAFVYRMNDRGVCCEYFAVFSKTGFSHAWRTQIFRLSIVMDHPFYFDSTGSLFLNSTPPLLVVLAAEQTLVATSNLLANNIPGQFFVRETDENRLFVFCSFSSWDDRFALVGSTIRIDKLGALFVVDMQLSTTPFAFCLHTYRLENQPLQIAQRCSLNLRISTRKIELISSDCIFTNQFNGSTIIIPGFPHVFLDQVYNQTFAFGRIFQETKLTEIQVKQWDWIAIPKIEQRLERCLIKNTDENRHRPTFISLRPTTMYPLAEGEQLVTKQFQFLLQNDYQLIGNDSQLLTSPFNHRRAILQQDFVPSQLSCYLPTTRTITFVTECFTAKEIRPKFTISNDLSNVVPIEPPINFQFNRYEAGFPSVIVYNLADDKPSICDGWKNCSCISSSLSNRSIHCAKQIYTIDSTVNNRVYMTLEIDEYTPKNGSIFLIEEISKRKDFRILENAWTENIHQQTIDLFAKNFDQLTDDERRIFRLFSIDHHFFLGPHLHLQFDDEGLYHFRLTYLWNDQFCLTSTDLLILIISNTPTLSSYLFHYFLACIILLISMVILWIGYATIYEQILLKYFHPQTKSFFTRRSINERINFEILMKIREQSSRLLPYKDLIIDKHDERMQEHIKELIAQFQRNS